MDSFLADLRYTFRELRKRPTFALTAILSLALGIAATSAVFSVVYAVLIDPFPYPGSDRLMFAAFKVAYYQKVGCSPTTLPVPRGGRGPASRPLPPRRGSVKWTATGRA